MSLQYLRLNLDHPSVGCGWRAFVVEKIGHKWAHICEPATGTRLRIPREDLRGAQPVDAPRWRKIAKQLRTHGQKRLAAEARTAA